MEMIALESARTRVTIAPEHGGRIVQIEMFDGALWLPLLYAPDAPIGERDPLAWGCYAMLPWPNRVADGRFTFEGAAYQLPANDAAGALHGVGFDHPWTVDRADADACELSLVVREPAAWPWPMRAVQRIELLDDAPAAGLRQTIELHALDGARFPAGCGWHPWFRRDVRPVDDVRVLVDADQRYELRGMIPTGRLLPVEGDRDLRSFPRLGDRRLDDCYPLRAPSPRGDLLIRWGDVELAMRSSANAGQAVVHTPPHAICIEPQTCAIDAFNLESRGFAAGVAVVDPEHPLIATTEWRWRLGAT